MVGEVLVVLGTIVLIVVLPLIFNDGFIQQLLQTIAFYTIAAIGLAVLVGYQGQVSLGQGALFAFGAYGSAKLSTAVGLPVWLSIPLATAIAGLAGFLVAVPTLRARGHYLAMVTISLAIVTFVVAQSWLAVTNGPQGIGDIPRPEWFGDSTMGSLKKFRPFGPDGPVITGQMMYFWLCALIALAVQLLGNNLLTGRWGRTINAVRQSEIAAESIGVSVYRMKLRTFTFSAALAGLAGALFAHQQGYIVSDTFTFDKSVELLVFVILGGARSLFGPLVGTTVLVVLPEILKTVGSYDVLPQSTVLQAALLSLGLLCALGLWLTHSRLSGGQASLLRLALTLGLLIGFIGFMLVTPVIIEHFLLVYGALLIVFLLTMPTGIAGFVQDVPCIRRWLEHRPVETPRTVSTLESVITLPPPERRGALAVDGLSMRFGGLKALDSVSLRVEEGSIHGLIGPNGSGKSTLVNVATGIYTAAAGEVRLGTRLLNALAPHQIAALGVARTFQNIQLFKDLSVLDNVMLGFSCHRRQGFLQQLLRTRAYAVEEADVRERALGLLAFLEIEHLASAEAQTLPYGHQRLVEIARALATGPAVLLLDEPAAGINPSEIGRLAEVIRRVCATGITILVIEHHMELVMGVSNDVTVLDYGRKLAEGTPTSIQANKAVIEAYLGSGSDAFDDLRRLRRRPVEAIGADD
jgi:branched-chain amino acid transport system permease protein